MRLIGCALAAIGLAALAALTAPPARATPPDDAPRAAAAAAPDAGFSAARALHRTEDAGRPPADAAAWRRGALARIAARGAELPPLRHDAAAAPSDDDAPLVAARGALFLHSLRRDLGAAALDAALSATDADPAADWDALRRACERSSRRDLAAVFADACERPGLPTVELAGVEVRTEGGRIRVSGRLRQVLRDGEKPWRLAVPLVVEHLEGRDETILDVVAAETGFALAVPSMPLRLELDPDAHCVRAPVAGAAAARLLLPDLRAVLSTERADAAVRRLSDPKLGAAAPGSPDELAARAFVVDQMRLAGVEPDVQTFRFAVKHVESPDDVLAFVGGAAVAGAVPLVASPATPADGLTIVGAVGDDDPDLTGRALVVDLGWSGTRLDTIRAIARTASAARAAAVFVREPEPRSPAWPGWWLAKFPERVPTGESREAAVRLAAAIAAATGSDDELPLPVLIVPREFTPSKETVYRLRVRYRLTELESANVVGRVRAPGPRRDGPLVLAAHLDGETGAAGVAALLEAVHALGAQPDLLARDVTVVVLGAHAWGDRGERAFFAAHAATRFGAMVVADGAGRPAGSSVGVLGVPADSRLGRTLGAAFDQSFVPTAPVPSIRAVESSPPPAGESRGEPARAAAGPAPPDLPRARLVSVAGAPGPAVPVSPNPADVARLGRALALTAIAVSGGW